MTYVVCAFLGLALVLYAVLGGADFGAGIWEGVARLRGRSHEELVTKALGPVWEANHVWLILALVIVFTAFPAVYAQLSVTFHVPLTLLLLGITLRGCAFTFRHYDAVKDESRRYYSLFFQLASALTPLMLGMVAAGLTLGRVTARPATFYDGFIAPWLNPFGAVVGLFLTALFCFVAAAFLSGEAKDPPTRALFARRALVSLGICLAFGLAVFPAASASGLDLFGRFAATPLALVAMVGAVGLALPFALALRKESVMMTRLLAGALCSLVLLGWFAVQLPTLIAIEGGGPADLTVWSAAAPAATLRGLVIALVAGALLIFPALGYLFLVFKVRTSPPK